MKIFLPFVLVLLLFGCQKQTIVCTGNCGIISISGTTFNKITNTAEPNVPISLDWAQARICICSQKNVFTGQSGSDGSFAITANIDTSLFKDHGLKLYVPKNDNFIVIRDSAFVNVNSFRFYASGGYPTVRLNIYPQATLKIILQRSLTDNFESFGIEHSAVSEYNTVSDYAVSSPKEVTDRNVKELTVPTVAGVFTKIIATKRINSTQIVTQIDSVRCMRGGANTYTVVF